MATMTYTLEGAVNCEIIITENADGSLTFTINVLDDTGSIGDLNAFFFDLKDDSKTTGLIIDGADVTETALKIDGVTKVDSYTNMSGEVINTLGKFDGGIQFGTQGIGVDDIRSTTFTLSHADGLSIDDFNLQDFGLRLTSVGAEDGSRSGSLKLGGTFPEAPPSGPVHIANDDTMTVTENNFFEPAEFGGFDLLDGADPFDPADSSLLANDTTDGAAYLDEVFALTTRSLNDPSRDGPLDPLAIGQIIEHPDGGALIVYANGAVDFSVAGFDGVNDFSYLAENETAQRVFEYAIDGDDTALLTVTILGVADGGGGDGWGNGY